MLDHNAPTIPMPATPPVPPQPTFPQNRIDVQDEGIIVTTYITPHSQFVQFIPDDMINQINKRRLEIKKKQRVPPSVHRTNTGH